VTILGLSSGACGDLRSIQFLIPYTPCFPKADATKRDPAVSPLDRLQLYTVLAMPAACQRLVAVTGGVWNLGWYLLHIASRIAVSIRCQFRDRPVEAAHSSSRGRGPSGLTPVAFERPAYNSSHNRRTPSANGSKAKPIALLVAAGVFSVPAYGELIAW
jgi:hypothetical protein